MPVNALVDSLVGQMAVQSGQRGTRLISDLPVAALLRPEVGARGAGSVAPLFEQHAEVERSGSVSTLIRANVGGFGARQVSPPHEQSPEDECRIGVAALVGAAIRSFSSGQIVLVLEEDAEIARSGRVAELIRSREERPRAIEVRALGEHAAKLEASLWMAKRVCATVRVLGARQVVFTLERRRQPEVRLGVSGLGSSRGLHRAR